MSCAVVELSLINVPDVKPLFSVTDDNIRISENTPAFSQIYKLSAASKGELIQYRYNTSTTSSFAISKFSLNPSVGRIAVSSSGLDYEKQQTYNLYIFAENFGNKKLTSNTFHLQVALTDTNDNAPVFDSVTYNFEVDENASSGTLVGNVRATDADGSITNNNVTYYLLDQQLINFFYLDPLSGRITVRGAMDHEQTAAYKMTVCATDNGKHSTDTTANAYHSCALVLVLVKDINEDVPRFDQSEAVVQLTKYTAVGFKLYRFSATDVDKTAVLYEYDTQKTPAVDRGKFVLNRATGELTVNVDLSRDNVKEYLLHVKPIDSISLLPGPSMKLTVKIIDTVSRPNFAKPFYAFTVDENTAVGSLVGSVAASSSIAGVPVFYYILKGQHSGKVSVDSSSGGIVLKQELDYETAVVKTFTVNVCANETNQGKTFLPFFYCLCKSLENPTPTSVHFVFRNHHRCLQIPKIAIKV